MTDEHGFPTAEELLSKKSPMDECPVCDAETEYFKHRFKDGGSWEFWKCPKGHGKWQLQEGQPEYQAWWKEAE